jgi:hypothetical protein
MSTAAGNGYQIRYDASTVVVKLWTAKPNNRGTGTVNLNRQVSMQHVLRPVTGITRTFLAYCNT